MPNEKEIDQYIHWFNNLSFFSDNSFILDNIEDFYKLTLFLNYHYSKIDLNIDLNNKKNNYPHVSTDDTIKIVQDFLNNHNININLNEMLENNTLITQKTFVNKIKDSEIFSNGKCYYDEKDNLEKIIITTNDTLYDSFILVHELMHYLNEPKGKRSFTSDLLTESISYAFELIFYDNLENTKYASTSKVYLFEIIKLIIYYAKEMSYIYKVILLYKHQKGLSQENYNKEFNDENYELTMKKFKEFCVNERLVIYDSWYIIAFPLAIYMFDEYQKDKKFINNIIMFNNSINNKELNECLKILNINDIIDLKRKIEESTPNFLKYIEKKTNLNNEKKM